MKRQVTPARPEWGSWVWAVVGGLLVTSLALDVNRQQLLSNLAGALAFFTAFGGVVRMSGFWSSHFDPRTARLVQGAFACAFALLMVASIWPSAWSHTARAALAAASALVFAIFVAVVLQAERSRRQTY